MHARRHVVVKARPTYAFELKLYPPAIARAHLHTSYIQHTYSATFHIVRLFLGISPRESRKGKVGRRDAPYVFGVQIIMELGTWSRHAQAKLVKWEKGKGNGKIKRPKDQRSKEQVRSSLRSKMERRKEVEGGNGEAGGLARASNRSRR